MAHSAPDVSTWTCANSPVRRKLRIHYPGTLYLVASRGDRREAIFLDDADRQDFVKTPAQASQNTGRQVHGVGL